MCGLAPSLPMLILFRVLQGVGGGALQPVSQAILRETFPREKQGMAMAVYGMGVVFAPVVGPTLGRLDYRQLHLALDFPDQHSGRYSVPCC